MNDITTEASTTASQPGKAAKAAGNLARLATIGIDLAKNIFALHGVDAQGHTVLRKQLRRNQLAPFFANLQACLIGMEACASAHHWARKLQAMGHTVRLMAPQFVKPYLKGNKNDANDAAAICEAVGRPNMHFVAIKTVEQQALLSLHRARAGMMGARTAQANQIRGLMGEMGIILPKGICSLGKVPDLLDQHRQELPGFFAELITTLYQHFEHLCSQVDELEKAIKGQSSQFGNALRRVMQVPGMGPLNSSALLATVGDLSVFATSRQASACMGIVPRQNSSGGKHTLLKISKRGDKYLRTLLIHGARSVVQANEVKRAAGKPSDPWLDALVQRRNKNVAAVAQANKMVRIVWAILTKGHDYDPAYKSKRQGKRQEKRQEKNQDKQATPAQRTGCPA